MNGAAGLEGFRWLVSLAPPLILHLQLLRLVYGNN